MIYFIEDFWNTDNVQLQKPDLACLRQKADLYKTLLFQPRSDLEYDNFGLYYKDTEAAFRKFSEFFSTAISNRVDLAITPEYSCPWGVIQNNLTTGRFPGKESLWVVGCQSISPAELDQLIKANDSVVWIYDHDLVRDNLSEVDMFFDPVCLQFRTRDAAGKEKNVIIVQFKTYFFGGQGYEWERDHLIQGDKFYILNNEKDSTSLITLICSDTINTDLQLSDIKNYTNLPFLIVHIQLNQKPNQDNYKMYRNNLFSKSFSNKEIICLNWARGVLIDKKIWNEYGGSAIYQKSEKLDLRDETINHNHRQGLYYTRWANKRTHLYLFNYDEHLFLFKNTLTSQQDADPSQENRTGPKMASLFQWVNDGWKKTDRADDGLSGLCASFEADYGPFDYQVLNLNPVYFERMITICSGEFMRDTGWYKIDNLGTFQIDDTEINKRSNFVHNPDPDKMSKRKSMIKRYAALRNQILTDPQHLPPLFENVSLKFDDNIEPRFKFLLNAHNEVNQVKGTAVNLGDTSPIEVDIFKNALVKLLKESQQIKQVMIYYFYNNDLCKHFDTGGPPRVSGGPKDNSQTFTRTN
jgi:hypothetical protein